MALNPVVEIEPDNSMKADSFVDDESPPVLDEFDFDAELRDFVDNIMVRAVVELQKKPTEASDTLV